MQQGRSFDGLRLSHPFRGARVDGFWFRVADENAGHADDAMLTGAYATLPFGVHAAEAFALWNTDVGTSQGTAGGRALLRHGIVSARFEGAAQFGERGGFGPLGAVVSRDVAAHLLSAAVSVDVVDGVTLSALYDRLSGGDDIADDGPDGELRVFDTLFGTNHKFYGFADVFTNIPAHTAGRGLQDLALGLAWRPLEPMTVTLDLHRFHAAAGDGMDDTHFGDEVDVVVGWRHSPNLGVSGGVFWYEPGDGFAEIGRFTDSLLATYIALDVTF